MTNFADGKDDGALRTIGEVSEALGIKPHVLRYWERQFSLLKPLKRSGGRRYYRPADVALVERIDRLVNAEGYTLKGAETVLRADRADASASTRADTADRLPGQNAASPEQVVTPMVEETIARLKSLRERLARAIEA